MWCEDVTYVVKDRIGYAIRTCPIEIKKKIPYYCRVRDSCRLWIKRKELNSKEKSRINIAKLVS